MYNSTSVVNIKDMRLFCQTRDRLYTLRAPDRGFFELIKTVRRDYIQMVGLKRYLSDMLSYHAGKPAGFCTAFYGDQVIQGKPNKRILDFIIELTQQHPSKLPPTRVEIREAGSVRTYNI